MKTTEYYHRYADYAAMVLCVCNEFGMSIQDADKAIASMLKDHDFIDITNHVLINIIWDYL